MKDALPWILGGGALLALFYFYTKGKQPAGYVPGAGAPPQLPPAGTVPGALPEGNVWGALQGLFGVVDTAIDTYGGTDPAPGAGAPAPVIQTSPEPQDLIPWFDD